MTISRLSNQYHYDYSLHLNDHQPAVFGKDCREKLKLIVTWSMIIILVCLGGIHIFEGRSSDENINRYLQNYTYFDSYKLVNSNPRTYIVSKDNKINGYLVFDNEKGYQSTISLATLIDKSGNIVDVRIYSENETPAFIRLIEDVRFLEDHFGGKNISQGFQVGLNVDAVSRATITSKAFTKIIHKSSAFVGSNYLGIEVTDRTQPFKFGWTELALIVMFALALLSHRLKEKKLRTFVLVYSVVIVGFTVTKFLTFSMLFSAITGHWPSIYENISWYLLIFGVLGINLVTGKNIYCTYMCPFGAVQELEYKIAGLRFFKASQSLKKLLRLLPAILVYLSLMVVFLTHSISALNTEPFSLLFGRLGTDIQWVLLPFTLFPALFIMRFYCKAACPVGYILNLIIKLRRKMEILWKRKLENKTAG